LTVVREHVEGKREVDGCLDLHCSFISSLLVFESLASMLAGTTR
jgi:hypothetical protein